MRKIYLLMAACSSFAAQAQLTVSSGTELKITNGATIVLNDMSLVNNGTISKDGSGGSVVLTGSSNVNWSGSGNLSADLTQNRGAGTRVTLLSDVLLNGFLNLTSGDIFLGNFQLDLGATGSLQGEKESSRIYTDGNGVVYLSRDLGTPSGTNPGNVGISITTGSNLGSTVIRRGHLSQTNAYGQGNSVLRYFEITPSANSGLNATLRFFYLDAELNGLDETALTLWKRANATSGSWTNLGRSASDAAANYVEQGGINNLTRFTLTIPNNPLPVVFSLFNYRCDGNKVHLTWKTSREENTAYFEVQRSTDRLQWSTVATVNASGNSMTERSYNFTDNSTGNAVWYRIAEISVSGRPSYSSNLRVVCNSGDEFTVWPNPVVSFVQVTVKVQSEARARITMYDSKGRLVLMKEQVLLPGMNQIPVDMQHLTKGTYFMQTSWNGETKFTKLVKE